MPQIRLKVFDSQSSEWIIDEDIDVTTMQDVMNRVGVSGNSNYTNRATRQPAFSNPEGLVQGDLTLFKTSSKSKAGH